jgi:hypothetical protein
LPGRTFILTPFIFHFISRRGKELSEQMLPKLDKSHNKHN